MGQDEAFGAGDRTVIRPRAGDAASKTAAPDDRTIIQPRDDSPAIPASAPERTVFAASPALAGGWEADTTAPPVTALGDGIETPSSSLAFPSSNPLLSSAAPVLSLLARLPSPSFDRSELASLGRRLADFEADSGASRDHRAVLFMLCETADDLLAARPSLAPGARRLTTHFFEHGAPAQSFFDLLNRLLSDPRPNVDQLEVASACLALGYEGQYRRQAGDGLRRVREDVTATLRHFQQRRTPFIGTASRNALSQPAGRSRAWIAFIILPAIALGAFLLAHRLINETGDAVAASLRALNPADPIRIERVPPAPVKIAAPTPSAPSVGPLERLSLALASDVAAGAVTIERKGDAVVLKLGNQGLFQAGGAKLDPAFAPLAERIAVALRAEGGTITVTGYTDNIQPRANAAFKSNQALSEARAEAVAQALAPTIGSAAELAATGMGEADPIADNATAEGRARNRRVEITLPSKAAP